MATQLDANSNNQEVQLLIGTKLTICLPEKPVAGGYTWELTSAGEPTCRVVRDKFAKSDPEAASPPGGQEREVCWELQVVQSGINPITIVHRRSWEKQSPAETFTVWVRGIENKP
jgi:predicted secreted protein